MRCAGLSGATGLKRHHYYHAHCLGSWVVQCQSSGNPASCPQCRGPVQVSRRRLEEFLQEEGDGIGCDERAALVSFSNELASDTDPSSDGWVNVKSDLLRATTALGVGAAVAVAVAAGFQAYKNAQHKSDRRRK